ncbi:MAG: hypothetical protein WD768_03865 [Phycisphaeraceae bacterium]
MPRDQPTIVISVHGGLVQDVFCSEPDTRVILVDWDQEGQSLGLPGIVEVQCDEMRTPAAVVEYASAGFDALKDSEVGRALDAGYLNGQLDEPVTEI